MLSEGGFAGIREQTGKELAAGGTGANLSVSQGNWTLRGAGGTRQLFTAPSASIFHSLSTCLAPPSTHTQPFLFSHPFPTFKADFGHFGKLIVRLCRTPFHTSSPFLHLSEKGNPKFPLKNALLVFSQLPTCGALVSSGSCHQCQ